MKRDKKAVLSLLAGAGLITSAARRKGSSAKLTTMGAETTWRKQSQTYQQKNLILLTIREAVQNSLDAVRVAIDEGTVRPEDAFIAVYVDAETRTVTIDDTGIGMDMKRAMTFLTMHGTDKGDTSGDTAAGGWGVAKAVIYSLSDTIRAALRTQDLFVPVEGFAEYGEAIDEGYVRGLPWVQGTRLIIYDVQEDQIVSGSYGHPPTFDEHSVHLFGGRDFAWDGVPFEQLLGLLLGSVGTDIPIYLGSKEPKNGVESPDLKAMNHIPRPRFADPGSPIKVGKIFDPAKLTRISPVNGRKSRKKTVDELWKEKSLYLRAKLYLGKSQNLGRDFLSHGLASLDSTKLVTCVRLNGMFMFYTTTYVSSKGIQGMTILYDIYTNIRPYQEEVYPVSKTRENLTGKAKSVLDSLLSEMNQEAVSAGADYEATVIQSSSLDGLAEFQGGIIQELFKRAGISNDKEKNRIEQLSQNIQKDLEKARREVERNMAGSTWQNREFQKKSDIRTSGSSPLHSGVEADVMFPNFAPVTPMEDKAYNTRALRLLQYTLLDIEAWYREMHHAHQTVAHIVSDAHPGKWEYHLRYMEMINRGINELLHVQTKISEAWSLFVFHGAEEPMDLRWPKGDLMGSPQGTRQPRVLMPPLHLVIMDVRDVLARSPVQNDHSRMYVNRLGLLIALFGNPQGFGWLWENLLYDWSRLFPDDSSDAHYGGLSGFRDIVSGIIAHISQGPDYYTESGSQSYFYGMKPSGFWWPKLQLTELFFGTATKPWTKKRKRLAEKMFKIVSLSDGFADLVQPREPGHDLMGAPTRIQKPLGDVMISDLTAGERSALMDFPRRGGLFGTGTLSYASQDFWAEALKRPFALRTTYLGSQLVTMLQGMTDEEGSPSYPLQFLTEEESASNQGWEHGFTLGFVTYWYDILKSKQVGNFAVSYQLSRATKLGKQTRQEFLQETKTSQKRLQTTIATMRQLYTHIPKRVKDAQELPLEIVVNPFDGFGLVRYGSAMGRSRIKRVEKRSITYLPLLCCWSSLLGMINAVSGLKLSITCGLGFGGEELALAQSLGDKSGLIFLSADRFVGVIEGLQERNEPVDAFGTRLFSIAVHEFCHIPTSGHGQQYAYLRDQILDASLPYLPYMLELIAEQLNLAPPKQSARVTQLQAQLAIRQAEITQMRHKIGGAQK